MTDSLAQILSQTSQILEEGIQQKLHHGAQVYVSIQGQPIVDAAMGNNALGQVLTPQTLVPWMSSGKPVTAVAVMKFIEAGKIGLHAPVAEVLPEFAQKGKEDVTTWHLLTHTAGLRPIVSGWPQRDWDEIIHRIAYAPLQDNWIPGQRAGYDPARGWFILGEMLSRIDGRPIDRLIREEVLEPIGMLDSWLAIPPHLYEPYQERLGILYTLKDHELTATHGHEKATCTRPSPGGSMRGPIHELGLFYEMLMRGGETVHSGRLLSEESVQLMTQRQRKDMDDETFHYPVDFGLGLIINSQKKDSEIVPYGFGNFASRSTYGHGGVQSSVGFADPERQLVVAMMVNGCPGEAPHQMRFHRVISAIYEDLNLA